MQFVDVLLLAVTLVCVTDADVYMHNPRGSNNRLNEKSANRRNANRVFDSQNNNRGGYNAGDATNQAAGNNEGNQYRMKYFQSGPQWKTLRDGQGKSHLTIEWTNQHGCGGNEDTDPHKQNCNIVFQYMCQDDVNSPTGTAAQSVFRNGVNTNTQNYNRPGNLRETKNQKNARRTAAVRVDRGLQEPWEWYDKCYVRERNKGLFTADQVLKSNNGLGYSSAIYTRQNPNGNRRGYECPEERDYYPYWHPTPWKDIAILSENATMCNHYKSKSFNVQPYHECVEWWDAAQRERKHYSQWNTAQECEAQNGVWTEFHNFLEKAPALRNQQQCEAASKNGIVYKWGIPHDSVDGKTKECLVALDAPECKEAPWTRSNHLGNGRFGEANNYTWILPYFPSGKDQRCVLRIRYNISTDDYDPYFTDSRHNKNLAKGVQPPVQQNPYVEIGAGASPLRLAINTAQFGRTFQDRTHVFKLQKRPVGLENQRIFNLNVRGKRGNIVQTYPAVEYDFFPNTLSTTSEDLVHIQWTGSNTHNNGNPAGDGQAGDAGEGTGGTDRHNVVEVQDLNENYPVPLEKMTMWSNAEVMWIHHGKTNIKPEDLAISMASAGYYHCLKSTECPAALKAHTPQQKAALNNLLNNAPASYEGALLKFKKGKYHYICSRNNNFTNRSQKGTMIVR